jgi:hypothetical protein
VLDSTGLGYVNPDVHEAASSTVSSFVGERLLGGSTATSAALLLLANVAAVGSNMSG